jgi:hypothetical protein
VDWSNERYARLYTRDTDDWLALIWQAKALFPLMLRKVDRTGFLATKRGAIGVAAQTGQPLDIIVEPGLADLLRDGCVTEVEGGYLIPNFIQAQEASASPQQRNRAHREKLRDERKRREAETRNVSDEIRDVPEAQQNVSPAIRSATERDAVPNRTVPFRAEPSRAEPNHAEPTEPANPAAVGGDDWPVARADSVEDPAAKISMGAIDLTVTANNAITAKFTEQPNPLIANSKPSHLLASQVLEAGIPFPFAMRSVASQCEALSAPVRTMAYFEKGIRRHWDEHNARQAAEGATPVTPLPVSPRGSRSAKPESFYDAMKGGKPREASS